MTLSLLFTSVVLGVCVVATFMYIVIMGPSRYHRNGVVGSMYRLLVALPEYGGGACCSVLCCCGVHDGRLRWRRCTRYVLHERNWLMVIFYVALVGTVEVLYLGVALPRLHSSYACKTVSWLLVIASEVCYALAVLSNPGTVTPLHAQSASPSQRGAATVQSQQRVRARRRCIAHARRVEHSSGYKDSDSHTSDALSPEQVTQPQADVTEELLNTRYVVDGMLYALCARATTFTTSNPNTINTSTTATAAEHIIARNDSEVHDGGSQSTASVAAAVDQEMGTRQCLGVQCRTCRIHRPSRSKHCALCDRCVRRFDHHCPWINNDVAEGTQRYFLAFLFLHALSCTWASFDMYRSLRQFLISVNAWGWRVRLYNGRTVPLTLFDYVVICANLQTLNACLLFFAACIGVVLYCFWAYEMTYALCNLTMNDMNKIDSVVRYVEEQPSLSRMYEEAMRIKERLEAVSLRKPRALCNLPPPPPPLSHPTNAKSSEGNANQQARAVHDHVNTSLANTLTRAPIDSTIQVSTVTTHNEETNEEHHPRVRRAYRKRVVAAITADLRGLFDRGWRRNLYEVLFPYTKQ